jgi:hypothetical protein
MRLERRLLRLGEYLVGRACQQLPQDVRAERYREWAAELPAILHDPQIRPAPRRAIRMLGFAADTLRGTAMTAARARARTPRVTAWVYLLLAAGLVNVVWDIWVIVQAPGQGQSYLQLTWALLFLAIPISLLAHSTMRVPQLLAVSATLTGVAVNLWNAAQAPGYWVSYFFAATLLLSLVAAWLISRWSGPGRHKAARTRKWTW